MMRMRRMRKRKKKRLWECLVACPEGRRREEGTGDRQKRRWREELNLQHWKRRKGQSFHCKEASSLLLLLPRFQEG